MKEESRKRRLEREELEAEERVRPPKKKHKKRRKKKKKNHLGVLLAIMTVLLLIIGAVFAVVYFGYSLLNSDKTMPNVYAGDIYLGSMTYDEAVAALDEAGYEQRVGGTLEVELAEGITFSLDYVEVGACPTKEMIADAAFACCRGNDMYEVLNIYMRRMSTPIDVSNIRNTIDTDAIRAAVDAAAEQYAELTAGTAFSVNEDELKLVFTKGAGNYYINADKVYELCIRALENHEFSVVYTEIEGNPEMPDFDALYEQIAVEAQDATVDKETFEVYDEVVGVEFDVEAAKLAWENAKPLETVSIPVVITKPEITGDELRGLIFRDLLGEQTTYFWGSTDARICNIQLAAEIINGTVLLPGEVFSYNETVGERTSERGFKSAQAYSDGAVIYEVGGGICQVSSTIYAAMLQANLETVSRTCHQFVVNYLPYGIDATVSWGRPDFQFRNNTDYPIKMVLSTSYDSRYITVQFWGTNLDGTYCVPVTKCWRTYDSTYTSTQIGWGAACYREIYDANGNLLETIYECNSSYDLHDNEIHWPQEYYDKKNGNTGSGSSEVIIEDTNGGYVDTGSSDTGSSDTGSSDSGNSGGDTGGYVDTGSSGGDTASSGGDDVILG